MLVSVWVLGAKRIWRGVECRGEMEAYRVAI
jgi:hypothetical protein